MEVYNQGVQKLTEANQKVVLSQVFNFKLGHLAIMKERWSQHKHTNI